ncbi:MAG: glycosyltransferase family 39 protein [Candidatus Omnitrophota bacterium]
MSTPNVKKIISFFSGKTDLLFLLLLAGFLAIRIIEVAFYNKVTAADAVFISYARNILQGRLAIDTHGDFLGFSSYYFSYPLLHPFLMAVVFKIGGISYVTAKVVPVLFAGLCILTVYLFCKRYIGTVEAVLISALLAFDHLFFSFGAICRPEMTTLFFFTMAAITYFKGEENNILALIVLSGILTGLAFLSSLNALWLVIAFFVFQIASGKILRQSKKFWAYLLSFSVCAAPYYLWIFLNSTRRQMFLEQIFINSSAQEGFSLPFLVKKLLNPLADLYLMLSEFGSIYPLILAATLVFLAFNLKKFRYLFLVLITPLFMLIINERAPHYLLITMPLCYISFGFVLQYIRQSSVKLFLRSRIRLVGALLGIFFLGNVLLGLNTALAKPPLAMDRQYYQQVFEKYTEENSHIVTDASLLLSATGGRKIYNLALLTWERWRKVFTYEDIVAKIDPDYIILTESMLKRSAQEDKQNKLFQELLGQEFKMEQELVHPQYGTLWIYRRQQR